MSNFVTTLLANLIAGAILGRIGLTIVNHRQRWATMAPEERRRGRVMSMGWRAWVRVIVGIDDGRGIDRIPLLRNPLKRLSKISRKMANEGEPADQ